jgi:aspartate racemase
MKTIGLIGGMSWHSTLEYYRLINEAVAHKLGGLHSARIVLYSLDFHEIREAQREEQWDAVLRMLIEAGNSLKRAGADFLVLCTNTMHNVADEMEKQVALSLLHITDATGAAITSMDMDTVALLGTRSTMEDGFYADRLQRHFGIKALVPDPEGRSAVDRIIFDELCQGHVRRVSRSRCQKLLRDLTEQGAQAVVLACTELPLLVRPRDADVPLFDTASIHVQAAVARALDDRH